MTLNKKIIIFGSSEIAELAMFYFNHDSEYEVCAFTVDDPYAVAPSVYNLPLIPFSQVNTLFPPSSYSMHVAISYKHLNTLRQKKYEQAKDSGYSLASYVSSKSIQYPDFIHGDNCFILENQTIQPKVKVGNNVMIWSTNHLGHGCFIDDHAYISSNVTLCGHSNVGKRCFIGVNSSLKEFTSIGDDTVIGIGANVTKNCPRGTVVLPPNSTYIPSDDKRNSKIKKLFFQ